MAHGNHPYQHYRAADPDCRDIYGYFRYLSCAKKLWYTHYLLIFCGFVLAAATHTQGIDKLIARKLLSCKGQQSRLLFALFYNRCFIHVD